MYWVISLVVLCFMLVMFLICEWKVFFVLMLRVVCVELEFLYLLVKIRLLVYGGGIVG